MKTKINGTNCKILVCCHQPCELPSDDSGILFPIHVGAALSSFRMDMQRDDMLKGVPCDNISEKNPYYCELTALYWAWKNIKKLYPSLEYIGLNHYRRYFCFDSSCWYEDAIVRPENKLNTYHVCPGDIQNVLSGHDVLLARKRVYPYSLQTDYSVSHVSEDIKTLRNVINQLYPEYNNTVFDTLLFNNKLSHYNMFIMRYDDFEWYCSWLFSILEELERRIDISSYSVSQKRIWGYMGERLLNIWCEHRNMRIVYRNILKFSDPNGITSLTKMVSRVKAELSFQIMKPSARTRQLIIAKLASSDK